MEKVRVTENQGKVIENFKSGFDEVMHGLTYKQFYYAVVDGYEVEPEFKAGDWVTRIDGDRFYSKGNVKTVRISSVRYDKTLENDYAQHGENGSWGTPFINLRHATTSEIAEEKERRFFKKHDREPWELRRGDVLGKKNAVYTVWDVEENRVTFNEFAIKKSFDELKESFKVVCFIESRLDGDSDE